jgi:16S rRNA (uracil1498-N3)-methyltransferase
MSRRAVGPKSTIMHRFFLAPEKSQGENVVLQGSEAHHAAHVLRVRNGEQVTLLDGAGTERLCEVVGIERERVMLRLIETRTTPPPPFQLTLVQAVPKGKLFESIIQKATELGAFRIIPLLTDRVVMHLDEAAADHKILKWRQVALEAIKQCGSPWLPRVEPPQRIAESVTQMDSQDLALVGSLQPEATHPRTHLRNFQARTGRPARSVSVWIGPEGDFTPAELDTIQSAGALPISLGRQVLRTETAALYCLSFLNYELQAPDGPGHPRFEDPSRSDD